MGDIAKEMLNHFKISNFMLLSCFSEKTQFMIFTINLNFARDRGI